MSVIAAMQPRLDQDRTMPQRAATAAENSNNPDPTFLESLTASFRAARDDIPNARQEQQDSAYAELIPQLEARGHTAEKYVNTGRGGEGVRSLQVWADIEAERQKDPRAFPALPRTKAEFDAQWQAKTRLRMERDAGTVARSGWTPWLLGSFGAGLTDPINVGSMLLTGGGSTVVGAAVREGAINMGIEAVELPLINAQRQEQGRAKLTMGEAATSLAMAGVVGGVFGGAVKGAEIGGKAAYERIIPWDLRAAWALDNDVPRYSRTPDVNAAINVARADAEIRAASPYAPTYEGIDAHFTRLNETLAKMENGVKIEVVAPALRPATADIGGAVDSYIAAARRQESGGNDGARSRTSSASGRYGFIDSTWITYYRKAFPNTALDDARILARKGFGDAQDRVMRAFTEDNATWLQRNGIPADPGNLYVVHHMGKGGAGKIFRASPATPLEQLLTPEVMAANPHLANMTAGDFRRWSAERMGNEPGVIDAVPAEAPIVRPAELDAARPLVDGPDAMGIADIAPEPPLNPVVINEGLLTAMRTVVDDRNLSINDMPALARELGTDEESLQLVLQKLVDEGRLTLTKGGVYRRNRKQGPEDALTFIAKRGGISYDGLDPRLADKIDTKGHDLRNSGNLNYFVPQSGPLLRPNGQGLDRMGELLWEAGYFGPPETTPRPSETDLITWLDDAIRKKEKRFSTFDAAPAPVRDRATEQPIDPADVAAQAERDRYWQRYDRWNEAADVAGTAPMLSGEIARLEDLLANGSDILPPWREADLPSAEELAPYVLEMVNREIDDVLEAAYLEVEDTLYDPASYVAEGQAGGAAEGSGGRATDTGTARPGEARPAARPSAAELDEIDAAGLGSAIIDEQAHAAFDDPAGEGVAQVADSAWHDVRAEADPNIAAKDKQRAQLAAEAPMRAKKEQDGTMGTPLFDAADQPTFDLGDGKGARTIKDIEDEIASDEAAIEAIRSCLL